MTKAKPYQISKREVWTAYKMVKANRGAAGVDRQSLEEFGRNLGGNLYKIWNRMSSGSYFPPPVRSAAIPKKDGGVRRLGVPTVSDRIAQAVARQALEPLVEPLFHPDSYGYRPGRSALDAINTARKRCWKRAWIVDLDVKGFFDNIDHDLLMKAVRYHQPPAWVVLYIERWLKAPVQMEDGTLVRRTKGTPQGSVISPLLANLFLHYALDDWMRRKLPHIQFERYADDIILHCESRDQSESALEAVRERLRECHLELHPTKTKIVYCLQDGRNEQHELHCFDFLGYTFRPRGALGSRNEVFTGFLPAMSNQAAKKVRDTMRSWRLPSRWATRPLEEIARFVNPILRGWWNYYGQYYRSRAVAVLGKVNDLLVRWARRKYRRFHRSYRKTWQWLSRIAQRDPGLIFVWSIQGGKPVAGV